MRGDFEKLVGTDSGAAESVSAAGWNFLQRLGELESV